VWKFVPEAGTRVTTLESGETQGIYLVPAQALPRIEKNTALRVDKMPWPGVPRIWLLNLTKPPMDDVRVRRAINHAVDKEAFLATVYKGLALKAFAPLTAVMLDDPSCARPIPSIPRRRRPSSARRGGSPAPTGFARRADSGSRSC
jgi:ABC-type transport system substrate-binding protein